MNIPLKMNRDFEKAMAALNERYGEDFEFLNGFHETQLNFSDFIDGFIDKNVADVTIDANANASNKDIRSLLNEKGKSHDKLFAFNKIFYEMKKRYNLRTAKEWLETEYNGGFYLHDASTSTYLPYCYAYDLSRLATEGLFFLKNYNNQAPKHLTTFMDDVIEYISYMSNRSSGAVGIPNVLIWTYYFWKKDCESGHIVKDPEYYIKQCFQKFIYRLNQPFMRIDQTAFVNVSIFDRNYIEALFGGVQYPDGSYVIDCVEELIEHQKLFMEVVSQIRSENIIAGKAITAEEACTDEFKNYIHAVVHNCKTMCDAFISMGYKVVTGGTDNHLFLLDLTETGLTGKAVQDELDKHGITLNKNCVPNETRSPQQTSGVRIGTAAMTTKGYTAEDFIRIAHTIDTIIKSMQEELHD